MPEKSGDKEDKTVVPKKKGGIKISFKDPQEDTKKRQQQRVTYIPFSFYWLKDLIREFVAHKNFPDASATAVALISVAIAFPFFPLIVLIPLILAVFIFARMHPLLGLAGLLFLTLPMMIYQTPLLAWIFTIFVSVSLFIGYKHYRTINIIYVLFMLPLSYLGLILEIPALVLGVLFVGFRRGIIAAVLTVCLVTIFSGLTGIQNSGPVAYNATAAHAAMSTNHAIQYLTPTKSAANTQFISNWGASFATFGSYSVTSQIFNGFYLAAFAIGFSGLATLIQILLWVLVVFAMSNYVIKSRSPYKGAESSFFALPIPVAYIILSYVMKASFSWYVVASFFITPLALFALEYNNIEVVKALEVMKEDFLGKFGMTFEDLTTGTKETLNDVANYEETKNELREALLAPIEHREISGAYNVKSAKGILLFGPPGTGKTLIMRALSNELRARFFYVKTSSILSPYSGESAQTLSRIFSIVKKHPPAVLFIDEIDSIAGSREDQTSDTSRQLLSTLLSEMDGFQKIEGVVVVGATNLPQTIDPSIMRPGRFDKIIYMPLPDVNGRAEIFKYYFKKMPISDKIDYKKLGEVTERYSGADIKNISEEVSRRIADEALKQKKVIGIEMSDIVQVIKMTKPSTSFSQLEQYNVFKMDYERRTHQEVVQEEGKVTLDDVVGLDDAKKALYEAVEIPILHPNLVKKYDVKNIKGILLYGPPGTGKTMLMRAISNELGDVRMVTLSGADISKLGLERAIATIKQAFDRAKENEPSILFIDEVDSLIPSRENLSELGVQITSEFLQEIDGIKESGSVVIVGATNRPDSIDPAMIRAGRFDRLIFTPPPDKEARASLFELNLKKTVLEKDCDFGKLAEMANGFTGADIVNVCRQAKMDALEQSISNPDDNVYISTEDLMKIIASTKPSANSMALGAYMGFMARYGKR